MITTCSWLSPLGELILAGDGQALTGLSFGPRQPEGAQAAAPGAEQLPVFSETVRWLTLYFSGRIPDFTPPLRLECTPFRRAVWDILLTIPYGQTLSYGDIARRLAAGNGLSPMLARAVGGAVHHNPVALIVPCHRVIGADGSLTGYAAGTDRKEKLLRLEQQTVRSLSAAGISQAFPGMC